MKKNRAKESAAPKALFGIAAIIFVSAAILLSVLKWLGVPWSGLFDVVLTSLLLSLLAAPSVYWLILVRCRGVDVAADMSALTVTDAMTGMMNRRGITMGVLEAMAQAERYNTPLSVAMVDVDNFQRVNDELGRAAGDKALTDLGGVLADTLRMPDKVGRYGGEEFLMVLPHTGLVQARKIAERIRSTVGNNKFSAHGKRLSLTVSIGVAQYVNGKDLEHLLSRANAAVDEAKSDGGNRVAAKKGR